LAAWRGRRGKSRSARELEKRNGVSLKKKMNYLALRAVKGREDS